MVFSFWSSLTRYSLCVKKIKKTPVRVVLPKKGDALDFRSIHLMEPVPLFCVCGFQAILTPENTGHVYESHIPSLFCILVICSTDSRVVDTFLYKGENCVEQFIFILNQMFKLNSKWIRSDPTTGKKTQNSDTDRDVCGESFDKRKTRIMINLLDLTGCVKAVS